MMRTDSMRVYKELKKFLRRHHCLREFRMRVRMNYSCDLYEYVSKVICHRYHFIIGGAFIFPHENFKFWKDMKEKCSRLFKTIYVHPNKMRKIQSGNLSSIVTRYEGLDVGDVVEVCDTDEVTSLITKVAGVEVRGNGLFHVTLKDPATAFIE